MVCLLTELQYPLILDEVKLLAYPPSVEGVIQSFVERYNEESIDELEQCWNENKQLFPSAYSA